MRVRARTIVWVAALAALACLGIDKAFPQAVINGARVMPEISAPSNPAANSLAVYVCDDGGTTKLCSKDSAGTVAMGLGGGGSSGSTWHAPTAYASLPTCDGSTPDDYYPISTGLYDYVYCDGSAPYRAFVGGVEVEIPPTAANWTVVNGSSGTAADADGAQGGVVLSTATSVVGFEATLRAVPSAPFKKSMLVSFYNAMATDAVGWACGAMFSTGTAATDDPQWVESIIQADQPNALYVGHGTDFSGGGESADVVRYYVGASTFKLWIQLEDNNTTKFWRVCPDGPYAQCQTLFSVARATNGTPTHYGFHCRQYSPGSAAPWQITLIGEVTQ